MTEPCISNNNKPDCPIPGALYKLTDFVKNESGWWKSVKQGEVPHAYFLFQKLTTPSDLNTDKVYIDWFENKIIHKFEKLYFNDCFFALDDKPIKYFYVYKGLARTKPAAIGYKFLLSNKIVIVSKDNFQNFTRVNKQ